MLTKIETERISAKLLSLSSEIHENEAKVRLAENDAEHLRETIGAAEDKMRSAGEALANAKKEDERLFGELKKAEMNTGTLTKRVAEAEKNARQVAKAQPKHKSLHYIDEDDYDELPETPKTENDEGKRSSFGSNVPEIKD